MPGRCSPTTRKVEQSDSSPAWQAEQRAAGDAGIDHDPVARAERAVTSRPDRLDDAGAIRAHDVRKAVPHAGQAVGDEEIEAVERGGADPDQRVAGRVERRTRQLPQREMLEPADPVEGERLHRPALPQNEGLSTCSPGCSGTSTGVLRATSGWMRSESCDLPLPASATLPAT